MEFPGTPYVFMNDHSYGKNDERMYHVPVVRGSNGLREE